MYRTKKAVATLLWLALLTAPVAAVEPVRLTNTSGTPLCLRVEEASAPVLVQGERDPAPTELGPWRPGAGYCLQPGETCTLQVEGARQGGGRVVLQWRPAALEPRGCHGQEGGRGPAPSEADPWEERRPAGWGGDWY